MRYLKLLKQFIEPALAFLPRKIQRFKNRHYIFFNCKFSEYRRLLRKIAYAASRPVVHGHICYILFVERYLTLVRRNYACNHVESSGFSGSVRPQEADNLPALYVDINPVYNAAAGIFLYQPFCLK